MSHSAIIPRRSDRMAATASRLTTVSRRLTAERGLAGFTIEEVCAEVGVSRRTFFNYFPSKDEAVLGVDESDDARRIAEHFDERGSRGWPAVLSDLVDVTILHITDAGFDLGEHSDFTTAIEREPRLLARFMGMSREREQELAVLVARREGVPSTDPRVRAVITLFVALLRSAAENILLPGADTDFSTALLGSLAAVRQVAANPSTTTRDHQ